jgi:Tfp pilus assembly protein FimV
MDPASVFVLYLVGVLCLWLVGTVVHPALLALSRVGIMLPVGRRFTALAISLLLVAGFARAGVAQASIGPSSHRMTQMAEESSVAKSSSVIAVGHRPMAPSHRATHTVEPGDSLWRIARGLLSSDGGSPTGSDISDLWRSIYELNRDVIGDDPNLIHPGQVLQLPGR